MDAQTKIARAKTRLVLDQPFWGNLTLGTPFQNDDNNIPTMCTNGQWVKWSTEFVDKWGSDENVIFTVAHEISHIFLKHCEPIKEIDGQPVNGDVQNMAMDCVINAMLIDACIGKMPDGGLYEPQYAGQTWLKVYRELMKMDEADRPATAMGWQGRRTRRWQWQSIAGCRPRPAQCQHRPARVPSRTGRQGGWQTAIIT